MVGCIKNQRLYLNLQNAARQKVSERQCQWFRDYSWISSTQSSRARNR